MLVRSSSTPILQSLLPFSPSTSTHRHLHPTTHPHPHPQPPPSTTIRRTSSDPNFLNLKCSSTRRANPVLEPIPLFSMHHPGRLEEEADCQDVVSGEKVDVGTANEVVTRPLFLARGLGIDRLGSCLMNAGEIARAGGDWYGREQSDVEMQYKKLVEEDPSNALYMRNYAQFLYQVKGDLQRAEEYYSRAILAEPGDGQILSQYARLVWERHGDEERASSYFQRAVQTSPEDSYVLAAHARFLWEAEEDGCADIFHHGALASAAT